MHIKLAEGRRVTFYANVMTEFTRTAVKPLLWFDTKFSLLAKTNSDELERSTFNKKLLLQIVVKVGTTFIGVKAKESGAEKTLRDRGNLMRCRLLK